MDNIVCRKCGISINEKQLQLHHLFPKAHAIINNINADREGRVYLCFDCHKELHLILGNMDRLISNLWLDKAEGKKKNDTKTTMQKRIKILFDPS